MTGHASQPAFEAVARAVFGLSRLVLMFCAVLFCLALLGLTTDIVMRYAFHSSVRGMQEIVNLLFTWIYLLGIAALYARKGDAALSFVTNAMPPKARIATAIFVALLIAASSAILFYQTVFLIQAQAAIKSAELGIPEPFRFMPLAIASASITITSLIDAWGCLIWAKSGTRASLRRGDGAH